MEQIDHQSWRGYTALHIAAEGGHGADTEERNYSACTALLLTTKVHLVELLLGYGTDLRKKDTDGNTTVHLADGRGSVEITIKR